ncbi:MAG: GH92 family glycosyl hydrolase, partial [Deltaproteobacteria bacterium]|nr:GH92 family glycosyl hydrolase [Deltaproteobacteria bacterium]
MLRQPLLIVIVLMSLSRCADSPSQPPGDLPIDLMDPPFPSVAAKLVDPFIGTAGDGNTFPGAMAPWGLVSISPHNLYGSPTDYLAGNPVAPAGYRHGEPYLYGVGLTHLSGVGCPDLGAPVLAASVGALSPSVEDRRSSYAREVAWPGYYAVDLTDHGVRLEASATRRAGVVRFRFPSQAGDANVLIDAGRAVSWLTGHGEVRVVSPTEVEGSARTGLFCLKSNRQTVHFVIRFDQAAVSSGTWQAQDVSSAASRSGLKVGAFMRFDTTGAERTITARVGVSLVSLAGARANLDAEVGTRSLEAVHQQTFEAWEEALSRIKVSGGTAAQRTTFYTALYHTLLHPSVSSDVDGGYLVMGGEGDTAIDEIGTDPTARVGHERHTVFSLWDTHRTVHPLLTLVYPEKQLELLRSLTAMAAESGRPALWELGAYEVNPMVGDPLAVVVADSVVKGLTDFDASGLYKVMRDAALDKGTTPHRLGAQSYWELGYVPMEEAATVWGPVSTTLEYAFADWALAQVAAFLGEAADATIFGEQAERWRELFDSETGLLRPRNSDGGWFTPFDADAMEGSRFYPNAGGPGYVEGTAHHWSFYVPHDPQGLATMHGGAGALVDKLQAFFDTGRFVMWNEPDMATPYLFTHFSGESWRTQEQIRAAMEQYFSDQPDGLPGNDDAGTLSAWYVFSAMGFYPDPGSTRYSLASPLFDRVEISLSSKHHAGKSFVIT